MRLAHNKRLSGALGSCYSFRVDTENIFRCSVICFVFDRGLEQITTQVTRTQGIRAKNSSPIKGTNALPGHEQAPRIAGDPLPRASTILVSWRFDALR